MSMTTQQITITPQPFMLDFAVVSFTYNAVNIQNTTDHIIYLDAINIDESIFKSIFYQTNNFAINPNIDNSLLNYISFNNVTFNTGHFCLVDIIYENIENDLGLSRNMFSPCTNIALNKQLNSIKTLLDIVKTSTVICSLSWSDIVNTVKCQFDDVEPMPTNPEVLLILTVVFSSPTEGVNNTIIKFSYKVKITIA